MRPNLAAFSGRHLAEVDWVTNSLTRKQFMRLLRGTLTEAYINGIKILLPTIQCTLLLYSHADKDFSLVTGIGQETHLVTSAKTFEAK
jgi:hypothetical protein